MDKNVVYYGHERMVTKMSNTMKQRMEELMKKKNLSASELLMKIHDMLYPEQHRVHNLS